MIYSTFEPGAYKNRIRIVVTNADITASWNGKGGPVIPADNEIEKQRLINIIFRNNLDITLVDET